MSNTRSLENDKISAKMILNHMIHTLSKQPKQEKVLMIPESHASNLMACERDLENIFNKHAKRENKLMEVIEELRKLVISQPRYTENNQQEVVERDSFIRAMEALELIDKKLKFLDTYESNK